MDDNISPLLEGPNRNVSKKAGWTFPVALAGIATCLGICVPVGYCIGNLNTPADIIKSWVVVSVKKHYSVELQNASLDIVWSAVVSIFLVGGMIGSLTGAWVANACGRKGASIIGGVLLSIAAVLFFICKPLTSVEVLLLARLVCGLASGLITAVVPMYLMELAPVNLQGAVGILCPLGITFGVLIGQIVSLSSLLGTESAWHYLLAAYLVLVAVGSLSLPWLRESPKYLYVIRKDKVAAVKVLSDLRGMDAEFVVGELADMEAQSTTESWSIVKLLGTKELLLNLALVCALQAGQQLSGINAVFFYSTQIFEGVGLDHTTASYGTIGAGAVNFLVSLIMVPIVNVYPRRFLSILSCSLSVAFLVLLPIAISLKATISWMAYFAIVGVLGYVLTYGIGLGPIPYFIGSELFDVSPRPAAMALGSVSNWTGNFLVGMTFPSLNRIILHYSFFIFASFTFALTLFLVFCLPETNARVLAQRKEKQNTVGLQS